MFKSFDCDGGVLLKINQRFHLFVEMRMRSAIQETIQDKESIGMKHLRGEKKRIRFDQSEMKWLVERRIYCDQ